MRRKPAVPLMRVDIQVPKSTLPPPVPASEMPTVGRIVIVLGRDLGTPEPEHGTFGLHMAAIVTRVHSPVLIDATLFPSGAPEKWLVGVGFGAAAGDWCWPRDLQTAA